MYINIYAGGRPTGRAGGTQEGRGAAVPSRTQEVRHPSRGERHPRGCGTQEGRGAASPWVPFTPSWVPL